LRIIAHRGASAYEPENTLRSFERAVAQGADWIELDVRLTADGHPVVLHSSDLAATTDGRGLVEETSLAALRLLDAGAGERVPTLDEVLEHFARRCGLYVELKAPGAPYALALALRRHSSVPALVTCSFDTDLVREAVALLPGVPSAWLSGHTGIDLAPEALQAGASLVHLCWQSEGTRPDRLVTKELLEHYPRAGLGVVLWHEERPAVLAALLRLPVWGVCTNTPDVAVRLRAVGRSDS